MATGQKGGFSESKLTKTSTLFLIIEGEPISIELNKCDLDGLDSKGVRQVFTKILSGEFIEK